MDVLEEAAAIVDRLMEMRRPHNWYITLRSVSDTTYQCSECRRQCVVQVDTAVSQLLETDQCPGPPDRPYRHPMTGDLDA